MYERGGSAAQRRTDAPCQRGVSITLQGVTKTFPGSATPAVSPARPRDPGGALVVLIGPSGCGKTTTLRMINRLIEPTAGTITIDGTGHPPALGHRAAPRHRLRHPAGRACSRTAPSPRTSRRSRGCSDGTRPARAARVDELVDLVGLDRTLLRRYPAELSGGQQQRVGVARALAADPPVLLMDEPFGAVDPIVRGRLQRELLDLQAKVRKTIVLVTHDIDEAVALGDRVAVLNVGGVLEQYAPPDELLAAPANDFVASFLGCRAQHQAARAEHRRQPRPRGWGVDRRRRPSVEPRPRRSWPGPGAAGSGSSPTGASPGGSPRPRCDGAGSLADLQPVPPAARVRAHSTLREALEVILTQQTPTAVVEDADGGFRGLVELEAIRQGLAR